MSAIGFSTSGTAFTVKLNVSSAVPPFPSSAVTVMLVVPVPTSVTVRVLPVTPTVTIVSSSEIAEKLSSSSSSSAKTFVRSISVETNPSFSVSSGIVFSTTGALFEFSFTVKEKTSSTVPPFPSSAVTVILVVPIPTSVTVSVFPTIFTVTIVSFSATAEKVNSSLSASEKTFVRSISVETNPSFSVISAIGFSTEGAILTASPLVTEISSMYR